MFSVNKRTVKAIITIMYFSKFSYRINLILEDKYLPKLSRKLLISSLIMKFFARNFFPNLILEVSVFIRRKINSLLERFAKEIRDNNHNCCTI